MDEASRQQEDDLAIRQDGKVYPVGQVLRATYDAENHDTLGRDVTGLMLDLARVPYPPAGQDRSDRPNGHASSARIAEIDGYDARATGKPCVCVTADERGFTQLLLGRVRSWWER